MVNLMAPKSCVSINALRTKEDGNLPFKKYISLKHSSSNKNFPPYVESSIFLKFMLMLWSRALSAKIHSTDLFKSTLPSHSSFLEGISKTVV